MKSNAEWLAWGRRDPLFAVATMDGKAKADGQGWDIEEFYRLGTEDWEIFLPHWTSFGLTRASCLEIGCGAGRMTRAMAQHFTKFYALDISADQIAEARRHIQNPSVEFVVSEDGLHIPLADNTVDAVFSTHVFQHLDSLQEAYAYFGEVLRVMSPGGSAMIHLPAIAYPSGPFRGLHRRLHAAQKRLGGVRASVNRFLSRAGVRKKPIMRITSFELNWLEQALTKLGAVNLEVRMIFGGEMAATLRYHSCVMFRKPAA